MSLRHFPCMFGLIAILVWPPLVRAAGAANAGRSVANEEKTCQVTLPPDWKDDSIQGFFDGPGDPFAPGAMSGFVTSLPKTNLAQSHQTDPRVKVIEDSPQRYWFEFIDPKHPHPIQFTADVPGKHGDVCSFVISFDDRNARDQQIVHRIAQSLRALP